MSHPGLSLLLVIRSAHTVWTSFDRCAGRAEIELSEAGRSAAGGLGPLMSSLLDGHPEPLVFVSPRGRALDTAQRALPAVVAEPTHLLDEVDLGEFSGLTLDQIERRSPDWSVASGAAGGESAATIAARCDSFIAKAERMANGRPVIAVSHELFTRSLAARLLGLPLTAAASLSNDPASVGVFDRRRGVRLETGLAMSGWNLLAQPATTAR